MVNATKGKVGAMFFGGNQAKGINNYLHANPYFVDDCCVVQILLSANSQILLILPKPVFAPQNGLLVLILTQDLFYYFLFAYCRNQIR